MLPPSVLLLLQPSAKESWFIKYIREEMALVVMELSLFTCSQVSLNISPPIMPSPSGNQNSGKDAMYRQAVIFLYPSRPTLSDYRSKYCGRRAKNSLPGPKTAPEYGSIFLILSRRILPRNLLTKKKVPQKIYLAGSDNEIAQLIFGLTCCLPTQLLKDLTFSTYEPNIHGATTEIIGTSWLSVPGAEKEPHAQRLLLEEHRQQKLTLNCYTGRRTELPGNPLVENLPLAAQFARDATVYFMQEGSEEFRDKFLMLLDIASSSDRNELLTLYESLIIQGETPIKFLLLSSDYTYIAKNLVKPIYPKAFISLAMHDRDWWRGTGGAGIIKLRQASKKVPLLTQGLHEIAAIAIAKCVAVVKQEVSPPRSLQPSEVAIYEESVFKTLLDVMACAVPPATDATVW